MILRIFTALLLSAVAFALWAATTQTTIQSEPHARTDERGTVVYVIDGDTIVLDNQKKVRLIGIDTPELYGSDDPECFAVEAKTRAEQLLLYKKVRLVSDVSDVDQYDRLLRYVYIDDPISSVHEETSVNEILVHEGIAKATSYPPDTSLQETLSSFEQDAKAKEFGLWGSCK